METVTDDGRQSGLGGCGGETSTDKQEEHPSGKPRQEVPGHKQEGEQ